MPSRQHMEIYEKDQLLPEVVTTTLYKCSSLCNASQLKLCKQKKKKICAHKFLHQNYLAHSGGFPSLQQHKQPEIKLKSWFN